MSLVGNERIKLLATALNNVAVATIVTALIAPVANWLYNAGAPPGPGLLVIGGAWFLTGVILHLGAQWLLGRLRA